MPELRNYTPFPNFRYYSTDADGAEFGIVIVKATFEITSEGTLAISEEQAPMMFTDACFGEVNISSLWHPSDLVPHKPGTDVIVNAIAHAPEGQPTPSWLCGVRIGGEDGTALQKTLRVTGPRRWEPRWKRQLRENEDWREHDREFEGWTLAEPEPAASVPLRYEYAFGGEIEIDRDEDGEPVFETSHQNPIGRGLIDRVRTDRARPVPAPQIEAADEPIRDPDARPAPQSLGAIPPAWLPRRPKGGTYDQDWIDQGWPNWPPDYDFAYHQSAHPDLILARYLRGGETVTMKGLCRDGDVEFALPTMTPQVHFFDEHDRDERVALDLDTVLIDAGEHAPSDWRVFITWRCRFPAGRWERAVVESTAPNGEFATPEPTEVRAA